MTKWWTMSVRPRQVLLALLIAYALFVLFAATRKEDLVSNFVATIPRLEVVPQTVLEENIVLQLHSDTSAPGAVSDVPEIVPHPETVPEAVPETVPETVREEDTFPHLHDDTLECCSPEGLRCSFTKVPPYKIPDCEIDHLTSMLWWLQSVAHVPFHLMFGSLLGAVRGGAHMDYDTDIDTAVDRALWPLIKKNITQALANGNTSYYLKYNKKNPSRLYFGRRNTIHIDFWLYNRGPNKTTDGNYPKISDIVRNDILFPLRPCNLSGHAYWCPAKSEEYLSACYGKNWQTPLSRHNGVKEGGAVIIE